MRATRGLPNTSTGASGAHFSRQFLSLSFRPVDREPHSGTRVDCDASSRAAGLAENNFFKTELEFGPRRALAQEGQVSATCTSAVGGEDGPSGARFVIHAYG